MHDAFSGVWSLAPPLRLRGRAGVFHRRAAPPHSPVQASLSAGTSTFRLTSSWPNHVRDHPPATLCGSPFFVEPRAGSPPWRFRSPSPPSRVCPFTLRGLLQVRGLVDSSLRQRGSSAIPLTRCSGSLSSVGMDVLQFLDSSSVLMHSIRECIRRKKSAAVGATLARRCPGWDELTLGWESLAGRFFRVPSFVLVGSVSLVSWPFFAGSLHVVVSLSRRLLLPRSVLCVAWAHLACQKLRSKGQFIVLLRLPFRMHQVTHLRRSRGGYAEGFF